MKLLRSSLRLIGVLLISLIFTTTVNAASSNIKVTTNKNSVVKGNTFNVTVTVSASGDKLGTWQYTLSYDSGLYKVTNGSTTIVDYGDGNKTTATYNYTFKAIGTGSGSISVKSYDVVGWNSETSLSPSVSSTSVKVMTQSELEATYSTNANLKSLSVEGYELTPVFDKNTLEYSLELENGITSINVSATKEDSRSTVVGTGEIPLVEGPNKIEIVVTAQKGNTKTYIINANVKELDPIPINVDGKEYKLIRKPEQLATFTSFQATTIDYEGNQVPALYNETIDYTIVGARDESGKDYYFVLKDSTFKKYEELKETNLIISPLETDKTPLNSKYKKATVLINGNQYSAFQLDKSSNFALIYGINVETGEEGFYLYDLMDNTIQRYNAEEYNLLSKDIRDYFIVMIAFGAGLFLCLVLIVVMLTAKSSKRKKGTKKLEVKAEVKEENKKEETKVTKAKSTKEAKEKAEEMKKKTSKKKQVSEDTEEMFDILKEK